MKRLVNLFIIFHLLALGFWSMPGSPLRRRLVRPFEPYVLKLGLWHVWDMFAPTPLMTNFRCEAEILYEDGSENKWEFPRMEKMGLFEKIPKERYRKWTERVRTDSYAVIWDDTARWIARNHSENKTNPPIEVRLVRFWGEIPPPKPGDYQPIPKEFEMLNRHVFHVYNVRPEDRK